jgi:hypothetical protein
MTKKRRPPHSGDAEESRGKTFLMCELDIQLSNNMTYVTLESPLSDIDYTEDMKSSSMDATAPSAREISHIAVAAAASSIMAGSGTYDALIRFRHVWGQRRRPEKATIIIHHLPLCTGLLSVSNRMPPHALPPPSRSGHPLLYK